MVEDDFSVLLIDVTPRDVGDNVCEVEEEDESDLDLAWKMLDVARAIVEKQSGDTMEKVDILSALAEVALERGLYTLFWISFLIFLLE